MISAAKNWIKRRWPALRLRTILFATLFVTAALPGLGAVFLRVYENTLVRQTEAELVAQGTAVSAAAAVLWPRAPPGRQVHYPADGDDRYGTSSPDAGIDLSTTAIQPERPPPLPAPMAAPDALAAARILAPILDQTSIRTDAAILLLDRDGRIVAGSANTGSYARLPEVAAALAGQRQTALRRNADYHPVYSFEWLSRAAAIRVHHAQPIIVGGRVVGALLLSRSARALFRGLYEDRGKILLGVAAIFALLVVLSGVISRGVTRPIEQLGAATRTVAAGRGQIPDVPSTAAIEIQGLYADFAAMAAAIERRSRYLRDFAYAVSHEFKTPLAGIRGAIELLEDHPDMTAPDRHRFLANAAADADRLALLVTRLLDLARADMAAPRYEATDPLPVIARTADAFRTSAFAIAVRPADGLPAVAIPAATLEAAFATLFENSRQAGASSVHIIGGPTELSLILHVSDDGPGIAPADRLRLFEPFFTTRRSQGGTGLGLAIARSLLEASGASLDLEDGPTTSFRLHLPLAGEALDGAG